jgi:SAM-dependent methyltransferase
MEWKWEHEIAAQMIRPADQVLEIGSGQGGFLSRLKQSGCSCKGLELNSKAASIARDRGIDVVCESLESHGNENSCVYDVVCAFQALEHIVSLRAFIQSCIDVLKPGGKLIFSVPNSDSFIVRCDDELVLNMPPHHMNLWNINALIALARLFELRIDGIELEPLQPYHADYSIGLAMKNMIREYGEKEHAVIARNEDLVRKTALSVLKQVPGQTILAHYTKK